MPQSNMLKICVWMILTLLLSCKAKALDEFSSVKCSADISKALIGKIVVNDRTVLTEARHKELGLKNLGGSEISDRLFLQSWFICGGEYELLLNTKSSLIRDVLPFPSHSAASPEALGGCQINDQEQSEAVIAVLDNSAGYNARDRSNAKTLLRATAAWKIEEGREQFQKLSTQNLRCPMGAIITLDGGP